MGYAPISTVVLIPVRLQNHLYLNCAKPLDLIEKEYKSFKAQLNNSVKMSFVLFSDVILQKSERKY